MRRAAPALLPLLPLLLSPAALADSRTAAIDPAAVTGVTLVLTAPGLRTAIPLSQATLPGSGCTFMTSFQADKHAEMLDILKTHLADVPEHEAGHFYLRHAVYLRMTDGTTIRYLIGEADGWRAVVHGGSETGASGSYLPFRADARLLKALSRWAATDTAQKQASARCMDKQGFLRAHEAQP